MCACWHDIQKIPGGLSQNGPHTCGPCHDLVQLTGLSVHVLDDAGKHDTTPQHSSNLHHPRHLYTTANDAQYPKHCQVQLQLRSHHGSKPWFGTSHQC